MDKWREFKAQLSCLSNLRIDRWIRTYHGSEWQMHCFSDASERAYAAAVYAVVSLKDGFSSRLLAAKSKVAPTKTICLPKLELCGALLISKLASYILLKLEVNRQPTHVFCWSDSEITLWGIKEHPSTWKQFVANRVSKVRSLLPQATWLYVESAQNPSDLATRSLTAEQLCDSALWWGGPE